MIESLHSPHVVRVKALLSSKKDRLESGAFVVEGIQGVREALKRSDDIETLFLTNSGAERLSKADVDYLKSNVIEVSEKVADAMSDAMTTQGIIAICRMRAEDFRSNSSLANNHLIYLNEIQDPGNAGTILRTADAMGISAIFTSPGSVDFHSPKVVRSTAGSLWHIPVYASVELSELKTLYPNHQIYLLEGTSSKSLSDIDMKKPAIWIFGNEARGLKDLTVNEAQRISINMPGNAESLNLAAAAAIVMYEISRGK